MKRAHRVFIFLTLVLLVIVATGIAGSASASEPAQGSLGQALVLSGGESTNPREYDPATTHGSGNKLVYSGLVSFDPYLNLTPELAESWDTSPDGKVYTFHLRQNARFHNGREVTAQDVIYSWNRAASPALRSDTVLTYLGDIVGLREMFAGQADQISGLQALDEHTLQVTIDAPKPYFLLKLTYPTAFVLDQANVESGEEWFRTPNGTGPYKLTEWRRFEQITYEANPDFYLGKPSIPYVIVQLYSGVGISDYIEAGEIDITGIGYYSAERFLDPIEPLHNELITGVNLCTGYVVFDVTQPPFDDLKVRQAFSMAFDRQKFIDVILSGRALPAIGVFPPGLPGFNIGLGGLPYDPDRARQLLAESKYGDNLPPIVYTDAGIEIIPLGPMWQPWRRCGGRRSVWRSWSRIWNQTIIWTRFSLASTVKSSAAAGAPITPILKTSRTCSSTAIHHKIPVGTSIQELDVLLEAARVEQDVTKRIEMYQQAEQMIVDDAPVLFTTHSLSYRLVKPYVKGYVFTPIDVSLERYMWLEGK